MDLIEVASTSLSKPFAMENAATFWSSLARQDENNVARVLVIVRRVQPIDPPDKAA